MAITKKQALKTVLLPGILPRLKELFGSGFGTLAYLIAIVYNTVRILPDNHPYLKREMIGHYNSRQVIAEAANHIKVGIKTVDQIIIFFSVIVALIILLIQFILLIIAMTIAQANATSDMPTEISDFFITPSPNDDLAYRLLDLVFGIPDFFTTNAGVDTPLHQALHSMLEFYSFGMIIVGAMIIIYMVIAVVAETATSGIPFGQRFNKAWTPVRIIIFFGLLIPISNGLNGGQYITLAAAKLGSSLASTGWIKFNDVLEGSNETLTGTREQNVAEVTPSELTHVPAFMLIAKTCEAAYRRHSNEETFPDSWAPTDDGETGIQAWAVYPDAQEGGTGEYIAELMKETTFQNIAEASSGADIHIVFGVKDPNYGNHNGNVAPICGSVILNVTDVSEPGSAVIHTTYYELVNDAWEGHLDLDTHAEHFTARHTSISPDPSAPLPPDNYKEQWADYLDELMTGDDGALAEAVQAQIDQGDWQMPPEMRNYGWAGAGIWYNKIAQQNGALVSAVRNTPITVLYPRVMELVRTARQQEDDSMSVAERFTPSYSTGGTNPSLWFSGEMEIANALNNAYQYWEGSPYEQEIRTSGNPVIDTINLILGTQGLFEMCKNVDVHPLAQLSAVGKSMVDSSIRGFAMAGIFSIGSILPSPFSPAAGAMSEFFGTIGSVGLLIGFILFYVLPFMPFLYFFFAVGGWIKGIFEAIVAMPLWALAHLRIDGDGMPGDAAIGGYFLIFEIFIRPILIVFGLLAAISIFAAMIKVLNEVFYLVVSNLSGHNPNADLSCFSGPAGAGTETDASAGGEGLGSAFRGPVDEFFFTILYTITVYMIGTGCFKLIDQIPNNILRWINAEVPSFNDKAGDAAEGLMTFITMGGSQFGGQLQGSIGGLGGGMRQSIQQFSNPS